MRTLKDLVKELAEVHQLFHAAWLHERKDARRRIAELAVEFKLTPDTVGGTTRLPLRQVHA